MAKRLVLKSGLTRYIKENDNTLTVSEIDMRDWLKRELRRFGVDFLDPCCFTKYTYDTCCIFNPLQVVVTSTNGDYTFTSCKPPIVSISNPFGVQIIDSSTVQQMKDVLVDYSYGGQFAYWDTTTCKLTLSLPKNDPVPGNLVGDEYVVYKYNAFLGFATEDKPEYASYSDAYDLTGFNSVERQIHKGGLHYIKWFEISNINVFGNQSIFTDAFRNEFQDISVSNRGELDFIGATSENAQSWAKNYCNFVNEKLTNYNICGLQYFDPSSEVMDDSSILGYVKYTFDFYVILPLNKVLEKVIYTTYTVEENIVGTNWTDNVYLNFADHQCEIFLDSTKSFNIPPEYFGGPVVETQDCIIRVE